MPRAIELPDSRKAIPFMKSYGQPYRSWSLFLICNPDWLQSSGSTSSNTRGKGMSGPRLERLYGAFERFGHAIGPDHAAVWFWKTGYKPDRPDSRDVDLNRSAAYCSSLKLPPSRSPYLVVTTEYPGEGLVEMYPKTFPAALKNYHLVELNGADSNQTMLLLLRVADALVAGDVRDLRRDSEDFWRSFENAYSALRDGMIGTLRGITVKFDTGFFKVEFSY